MELRRVHHVREIGKNLGGVELHYEGSAEHYGHAMRILQPADVLDLINDR